MTDAALQTETAAGEQPGATWLMRALLSNEFGLMVLIVVFWVLFSVGLEGFASPFNLFTIGRQIALSSLIGFAMMVVIVTGGLDLSVGAIGVCAAMTGGWLIESAGLPIAAAVAGALALGTLLGAVNGLVIVRSGVHSFIITLASMSIFFGLMIFLSQAEAFRALPPEIAQFGKMRVFGTLSPLLLVAALVGLCLIVLYRNTTLGRQILAAGANRRAAELSGVPVRRMIVCSHMLCGFLAGLAALMFTARTGAAIPSMAGHLGQDWLLPAFLAPVLGGTLFTGGRVSVFGTFLGAVFVTMITSGLLLMRIGEFWVQACLGFMLLAAVIIDRGRHAVLRRSGLA
jgi:ribose transport system permease protein